MHQENNSNTRKPSVAVVILNWNGLSYLQTFVPALLEHTPDAEIWVVDNGSTDDSLSWLAEHAPRIRCIELHSNYGFTGGYNKGLAQIESDYYVLLNSDVEVTANWLSPMVDWMEEDDLLVACQPTIRDYKNRELFEHAGAAGGFIDRFGFPFCAGRIFSSFEEDKNQYGDRAEVFWATGACLVVDAKLYHELGGLDEDFFAHMEEIDLCWRLKNMGYKIGALRSSKVYHVGGGTLQKSNPFKTFLNFRNNLALLVKNDRSTFLVGKILVRMAFDGMAFFRFLLEGKSKDSWAVFRAHFAFYGRLPNLLRKRRALKKTPGTPNITGRYHKSIVLDYYLRGKKSLSAIKWKDIDV